MSDELMNRLTAARPGVSDGLLEPNTQLLEEILMTQATPTRRVTPLRLGAAAVAAAAAALLVVNVAPTTHDLPHAAQRVRVVNMQRIAESTSAAFSSGRAHLNYTTNNGHYIHDSGEFVVEFSGENRSTVGTLNPGDPCADASVTVPQERCGSNAFDFANKVVDGRFYLQDGACPACPEGSVATGRNGENLRWIEDTNEHLTGADIFSVDPRSLVSGAAQDAEFKDVGGATVDGVPTHHLKATRLDNVPMVNLGLGPINDDQTKVTKFDVWVDADNVVRRLDVSTSRTEQTYPEAHTVISKDANGNVRKSLDEATKGTAVPRTTVSEYTVVFTDLGSPITIEAPANARKVAGQG